MLLENATKFLSRWQFLQLLHHAAYMIFPGQTTSIHSSNHAALGGRICNSLGSVPIREYSALRFSAIF